MAFEGKEEACEALDGECDTAAALYNHGFETRLLEFPFFVLLHSANYNVVWFNVKREG